MSQGFIFILMSCILAQPVFANEKKLFLGAGFLSQNTERVSGGASGALGPGAIFPHLNLSFYQPLGGGFGISPTFLYTPMWRMSGDGGETSYIMAWSVRATKEFGSLLSLKLGLGELIYRMNGLGGTSTQNNGNGTATFALPSGSVANPLFSLNTGLGFHFSESIRADIDLAIVNLFSNKRAFNTVLSVGYGLL